ncbi:hypothetical protein [Actinopolymorpha singaporensis]|uniref:Polysaccharide lyase n=1 Tax=Actinopolymorpha singaporensis TaxID=117157 RepID=A0A1H1UW24_9ACTN|nr:hypothetical protein [Actinopolymorpha singaporensis]SDS76653.1 hypothetical protein SAMN04489717_3799 [Actinopolymorpha singaporensis]
MRPPESNPGPNPRRFPRRTVLTAGGLILASGAGTLAAAGPATARQMTPRPSGPPDADEALVWRARGPLAGYGIDPECNPGGTTDLPCGTEDVAITSTADYSEVTANPRGITTFVNAIGRIKFGDRTPDHRPISLATYHYSYSIRLPLVPSPSSAPHLPEQTHQMIQFWDGSNRLWNADKHTLEAATFWKLNPWDPNFGKIFAYTMVDGHLAAHDTGVVLPPDTDWHRFEVVADLARQTYVGLAVDGRRLALTDLPLASIHHPDWGTDLTLVLTAESENAWPGTNPIVTQWTTQYKDPQLSRLRRPSRTWST